MLLGIALHASMPFYAASWPIAEPTATGAAWFDEFAVAVHGFRMQIFYLLAGFFTAMMLRHKGLAGLLSIRARRIGIPFAVGLVTVIPLIGLASAGMRRPGVYEPRAPAEGSWYHGDLKLHHLWFLWFLSLYIVGFALVVAVSRRVPRRLRIPEPRAERARWAVMAVLVPLPVIPQFFMVDTAEDRTFGPFLSNLLLPDARVLAYYGMFFAFGALLWSARDRSGRPLVDAVGRGWTVILPVSLLVVLPVALATTFHDPAGSRLTPAILQVIYAWGMVVGLIGACRHFLRTERRGVRYLADASYWMYLMHLPLLIAVHRVVSGWSLPATVKFAVLVSSVTVLLLVSYEFCVRHTVIGRVLNGPRPPRVRRAPVPEPAYAGELA